MSTLTPIRPSTEVLVKDLRQLADDIESGRVQASTTGICVLRSRAQSQIHMVHVGDGQSYSDGMGMLTFATHMLYDQAKD